MRETSNVRKTKNEIIKDTSQTVAGLLLFFDC